MKVTALLTGRGNNTLKDKNILDVAKQIANFMFGTYTLSEGLLHAKDLLDLEEEFQSNIGNEEKPSYPKFSQFKGHFV